MNQDGLYFVKVLIIYACRFLSIETLPCENMIVVLSLKYFLRFADSCDRVTQGFAGHDSSDEVVI